MASPAKKPKVQSASDSIIQEVRGDPRVPGLRPPPKGQAWGSGIRLGSLWPWCPRGAEQRVGVLWVRSPADPRCLPQYVELRTRYSELTTLTSQYIKFITETLRRLEEEEVGTAGRHGSGRVLSAASPRGLW